MQSYCQIALMNIQKEILYEGLYDRVLEDMEDSEMFQECCFSFVIRLVTFWQKLPELCVMEEFGRRPFPCLADECYSG